jgi:hypothetical protein
MQLLLLMRDSSTQLFQVQTIAQFGNLPLGVDLIVMRQENVSAEKIAIPTATLSAAEAGSNSTFYPAPPVPSTSPKHTPAPSSLISTQSSHSAFPAAWPKPPTDTAANCGHLSGAAAVPHADLEALTNSLVSLNVGVSQNCTEFATGLIKEGVMNLDDLALLSEENARLLLRKVGMKEMQQIKVVQSISKAFSFSASNQGTVAHASASSPAFAGVPPLPPGWEELREPSGRVYYGNPALKLVQYERPLPANIHHAAFAPVTLNAVSPTAGAAAFAVASSVLAAPCAPPGQVQALPLPPLPPGWEELREPSGRVYYGNPAFKLVQYERPLPANIHHAVIAHVPSTAVSPTAGAAAFAVASSSHAAPCAPLGQVQATQRNIFEAVEHKNVVLVAQFIATDASSVHEKDL